MPYVCPVCGFPSLQEPARTPSGGGSYEICPCCGFQFGVSDDDAGFTFAQWRAAWRKRGLPWSSKYILPPPGWNAESQLAVLRPKNPKRMSPKKSAKSSKRRT